VLTSLILTVAGFAIGKIPISKKKSGQAPPQVVAQMTQRTDSVNRARVRNGGLTILIEPALNRGGR
jgi:hypothetical protein